MKIETLEIAGFRPALHGMRNPMDSWKMSDSKWELCNKIISDSTDYVVGDHIYRVGDKDKDLSIRLQKAGPEHCKHLRMIMVWADITAPRYWWVEMATYRYGVETVSCSTMHKLTSRPLTMDDFELDATGDERIVFESLVRFLNILIDNYKSDEISEHGKKKTWRTLIQTLPQNYLQKRTVMMSYAALRNIYRQRKGHKLKEWQQFREWVETLPESWMITDKDEHTVTADGNTYSGGNG